MTDIVFDYIIIGGGTAGCVLANRLSANPDKRVLLLESGVDTTENTTPEEIADGLRPYLPRFAGTRFLWPELNIWRAAEHPGVPREPQFYEQGRILGGGSSVNMMISNRGIPSDYDEWERHGAAGWGWKDVLPYFRRLESDPEFGNRPESAALHGLHGPLPIVRVNPETWSRFTKAAAASLETLGLRNIEDQNGRFEDGYFPPTFTIRDGKRVSSAIAYLDDATRLRSNLSIWTETTALALTLRGADVDGVEARRGGVKTQIKARQVILAAGALQTPGFLLRAGIGPADELRALGISVRSNLPGVGKNLWDHASLALAASLPPQAAIDAYFERTTMHQLGIRLSSGVDKAVPSDIFMHIGADPGNAVASIVFWVNKPSSRGALALRDTNPESPPVVDFRLLSDARDLERLKFALRFAARVFEYPVLKQYGLKFGLTRFAVPALGGPELVDILQDETALEHFLRVNVGGVWHASGTARIGRPDDPEAVVDPSGRVYGVGGLRVADASVFPTIPAANTNLPAVLVAEKIADAILAQDTGHGT
ncbi:MAG: GMC family oxidoreductase N-terminal domain-containing protein [Zoogloeaceae bacterium]|jgi:5-(hydroxymethyl)furfural/furfural oxidase|nr:GMC family oxidoreductase N-terminal domain-containing protein [Zoogloeaceae bacterium]